MIIATRLRSLRERRGLRQSQIATSLGIDPSIPSLWEKGKRPVPPARYQVLAELLGVSVDELLADSPVETTPSELSPGPGRSDERNVRLGHRPGASLDPDAVAVDWERAELPRMRDLLSRRLCTEDRDAASFDDATSRELVKRIASHCAKRPDFLRPSLPLMERVFRLVLQSCDSPISLTKIADALGDARSAVPLSLLRRLRSAARSYPVRWGAELPTAHST